MTDGPSDSRELTPYGAWPSPIDAETVASDGIEFGHVSVDEETVYWREQRPQEDGRGAVVRYNGEDAVDVTPTDVNVRTLVHEYGGGDFTVSDGVVYFVNYDDQRVYRQAVDADDSGPEPITPEPETERGLRYADFAVAAGGEYLYCVREDHDAAAGEDGVDEPVTELVRLRTNGTEDPKVVADGHDFYASPTISPAGDRLAWLTWDHPRMPWDGTELHVAAVGTDGTVADDRVVMGGPTESVFQPEFAPDGTLHAVSDRTGWWNIYRREDGGGPDGAGNADGDAWTCVREEEAEYGSPQWTFGLATYAPLDDGDLIAVATRDGEQTIERIAPDGTATDVEVAAEGIGQRGHPMLRTDGTAVHFVASGPATPARLVRLSDNEEVAVLRKSSDTTVDPSYVSTPDHITVPTRDGAETHAFVYPPTNPDAQAPDSERPPLIVTAHGGPTSATAPTYDLTTQFFTSRGFAVADVNYRGSTGYGRAYRESLYGEWGVRDVEDCLDVARHLAESGRVDGDRIAVRGGSAGGFVVLSALAFHDEVAAGTSYFGVADLGRLAQLTHKFESRYLDQLVGPYEEARETYETRSPVNHADAIESPVLLLQGAEDPVVPLSQAEEMADALAATGVPHDLVVFEGEQHGFRRADTRRRAHESELAFYGSVFGFDPANDLTDADVDITVAGDD
ncbi:prolyl oligopeptidase family serine peptidase [Halobaculum sp. CBA1158]|uniref:prolyl oligopeptidase family serine peptidase n=1 Tax=Halobaculum sp. CBA1158 TaxID=2904243 RepID=UPI001F331642|nr:prolyl oligopeptidase family serine peptidase [Halobaculum sp. CBA1158]UIP00357.1 prolyl oligopeptidase family serine peptidase [Halobaculum sp. CBA1158]